MRRRALVLIAVLAAPLVLARLPGVLAGLLSGGTPQFQPIPGLPGFRRLPGGAVSLGAGGAVLAGLDPAPPSAPPPEGPAAFCQALFGPLPDAGALPVAVFTDPYCPHCRAALARLADQPGLSLRLHQVPLLGPASTAAARIQIAADRLGAGPAMAARLSRSRALPDAGQIARLAGQVGLDPDRLAAAVRDPATERTLAASRGLFDAFGFAGTPGLVIGRTAVEGDLPTARLRALIADERTGPPVCSA